MTIHQVTLKRDFKSVKKGTSVQIITSSESDHSMSSIYRALRMAGYADEDFNGIGSSSYWDWKVVSGDAAALHNQLERYNMPVTKQKAAGSTGNTPKQSSKKQKSSGSSPNLTHSLLRMFDLDDEAEARRAEEIHNSYETETENRDLRQSQGELHASECAEFDRIKALSYNADDIDSVNNAINEYKTYLDLAKKAKNETSKLYFGAEKERDLCKNREKQIKANIETVDGLLKKAKNDLQTLKKAQSESKAKSDDNKTGIGAAMGGAFAVMGKALNPDIPGETTAERAKAAREIQKANREKIARAKAEQAANGAKKSGCMGIIAIAIIVFLFI